MTTALDTDQPTLPPIVCTPWCAWGDGHPTQAPSDQACISDLPGSEIRRDGDEVAQIYTVHRPGQPVRLDLWTRGVVHPTVVEARAFADAIHATCDLIEQA